MPKVGDTKGFTTRISNQDIFDATGYAADLSVLAVTQFLETQLAAQLAAGVAYWELAPGVVIGALATTAVAALNKVSGNDGFEFTFRFKYVEVYMHKEGHYYYGWDIDKISAGTYKEN